MIASDVLIRQAVCEIFIFLFLYFLLFWGGGGWRRGVRGQVRRWSVDRESVFSGPTGLCKFDKFCKSVQNLSTNI